MSIAFIKQSYIAGIEISNIGEFLSPEDIQKYYAKFFIILCSKIRALMNSEIQNEKKQFDTIGLFQQSLQKEIIYGLIKEVLFDYDISPHSIASDVELSVQTAFIKGYLEYQHLSEDENLEFELSVRGGPQPISDWIYSMLQVKSNKTPSSYSSTPDELLWNYFILSSYYSVHAVFTRLEGSSTKIAELAEDGFRTGHRKNGGSYVYFVADPIYGDKEILGGSYEYVKYFADSKTHEVHHLIPAKLLEITGILSYMEGPCIRMEKKDHEETQSYKKKRMLSDDYFQKQLRYLKENNIRAAIEIEITDLRAKFGSKYDDAIKEVLKYVSELEEKMKNKNGATYA